MVTACTSLECVHYIVLYIIPQLNERRLKGTQSLRSLTLLSVCSDETLLNVDEKYSPNSAQILPRSLSPSVCQLKLWVCSECQEPQKSVWRLTHTHTHSCCEEEKTLSALESLVFYLLVGFIFLWQGLEAETERVFFFFMAVWRWSLFLSLQWVWMLECFFYYMMSTWWVLFVILWHRRMPSIPSNTFVPVNGLYMILESSGHFPH